MPWAQIHWRSEVLQKQTAMQMFLPRVGRPPFATLYLLHGLSGDSTAWLRLTRLDYYVQNLPLIVVMPDGYRGYYTDNEEGPAYAKHFGEELPAFVEKNFRAIAARGARAIGGLSMGGYGALRIALGYPGRFCSANSHSGALERGDGLDLRPGAKQRGRLKDATPEFIAELRRIFGERPGGTTHDLIALIRRAKRRGRRLPKMLVDCGVDDPLIEGNRAFHADLEELRVPHVYREFAGEHNWDYWDLHIREALAFHAKNLRLPRV